MRYVLWLLLIFAAAVVAAVTLGRNDGTVAIAWQGWRADLSLNLFLAALVLSCVVLVMALQALDSLLSLPKRARDWRVLRRDRAAQSALREAFAEHFAARYRRAQKAAQRSASILDDTPELDGDGHSRKLAHLLSAASAHQLQDRGNRDHHLERLRALRPKGRANPVGAADEGAQLMAVEWALDDRNATQALTLLDALPPGAARRTQALRLKLRAQRMERQALEALHTARLLAKHQAFAPHAVQGLIRSLALDALDSARDADQLRLVWQKLDVTERSDAFIASRAARKMATFDNAAAARAWIEPLWDRFANLGDDERTVAALTLVHMPQEAEAAWLARVEEALRAHPGNPAVAAAAGAVFAHRQLWGKAQPALEQAAKASTLDPDHRRLAWLSLAQLARAQGDVDRAHHCDHQAAQLAAA